MWIQGVEELRPFPGSAPFRPLVAAGLSSGQAFCVKQFIPPELSQVNRHDKAAISEQQHTPSTPGTQIQADNPQSHWFALTCLTSTNKMLHSLPTSFLSVEVKVCDDNMIYENQPSIPESSGQRLDFL